MKFKNSLYPIARFWKSAAYLKKKNKMLIRNWTNCKSLGEGELNESPKEAIKNSFRRYTPTGSYTIFYALIIILYWKNEGKIV